MADENYRVDAASTTINITIKEFMTPTVSITPRTFLADGADYRANPLSREVVTTIDDVTDDIVDLTSSTVEVSATSNAGFTNIGGFYQAADAEGTVVDPITGNEISPGDTGYEDAALANSVVELEDGEDATLELDGGMVYVPYLLANGTQFFTAYEEANADGLDHVRSTGENTFGFEDLLGGGDNDFNDYIISFDIV